MLRSIHRTRTCFQRHNWVQSVYHTHHNLVTDASKSDPLKNFLKYKKLIGFGFLAGAFSLILFGRKKRAERFMELTKDMTVIQYDRSLFNNNLIFYSYRNCILPNQITDTGVLKELPDFKFRNDDVVVASFPKSGTTWLQEIVYMLTHNLECSNDQSQVLDDRFPFLEFPYPGIKHVAKRAGKRFIKTHLPYHLLPDNFSESGAKLLYVERDVRDVIVSFWHFYRWLEASAFTGSFEDFLKCFMQDKVAYTPYYAHLKSYHEQATNENILIVKYEDLKRDPVEAIMKISQFLQVPVSREEAKLVAESTSFEALSKNKSVNKEYWSDLGLALKDKGKFMRKGKVGDWKNHFTPELLKQFEEWRAQFETNARADNK